MHGRLAIISLRPDISRVDRPVLHARTMNVAIFSMIACVHVRVPRVEENISSNKFSDGERSPNLLRNPNYGIYGSIIIHGSMSQ